MEGCCREITLEELLKMPKEELLYFVPRTLEQTVPLMLSDDFKLRFRAEYYQTKIRYDKLHRMIIKMEAGTLDFEPTCSLEDFKDQAKHMGSTLYRLEVRAEKEKIAI